VLSHIAHDIKNQVGFGEPSRDWFPISFMSTFSDWAGLIHGPAAEWDLVSLNSIALAKPVEQREAEPVAGD
jgi:hypothetical protein